MTDDRDDTIILSAALLAGLDHAGRTDPDRPSRQELATRIIREWLLARGHLRGQGCDEGKRPDDLNTGNDD